MWTTYFVSDTNMADVAGRGGVWAQVNVLRKGTLVLWPSLQSRYSGSVWYKWGTEALVHYTLCGQGIYTWATCPTSWRSCTRSPSWRSTLSSQTPAYYCQILLVTWFNQSIIVHLRPADLWNGQSHLWGQVHWWESPTTEQVESYQPSPPTGYPVSSRVSTRMLMEKKNQLRSFLL